MKAELVVFCDGCEKRIGAVKVDTADMPEDLQAKVNKVILAHQDACAAYGGDKG